MRRRDFLRQGMVGSVVGVPGLLAGCGTLLHRERVNQPHSRDIDWSVAAYDGLGLILFFVPGVIAFAVDFYTGAIYLPPEHAGMSVEPSGVPLTAPTVSRSESRNERNSLAAVPPESVALRRLTIDPQELTLDRIEATVSDQTDTAIDLSASEVRASQLEHLDHFSDQRLRHEQDTTFGSRARDLLARVLPG